MSKTITLVTGSIVTIGLAVLLVLGKVDLQTFGMLAAAVLGVVYGFYEKVENADLKENVDTLEREQELHAYSMQRLIQSNAELSLSKNNLEKAIQASISNPIDSSIKARSTTAQPGVAINVNTSKAIKKPKL